AERPALARSIDRDAVMPGRSSDPLASSLAGLQPSSEGCLSLAGRPTGEKACDTNVFVEIRPVSAFATADQAPIGTFGRRRMCEPWVPWQRHTHRAAIDQVDD